MVTAIIHGFILAIGLILPLGAQNVFIFNQGANQPKYRYVLPAIITAGLSDSLLII
ncbi:amino acid transporter, partial [Staphylococcus aureus]|nr:amino acid transporter [Staphylococcus aureus]